MIAVIYVVMTVTGMEQEDGERRVGGKPVQRGKEATAAAAEQTTTNKAAKVVKAFIVLSPG